VVSSGGARKKPKKKNLRTYLRDARAVTSVWLGQSVTGWHSVGGVPSTAPRGSRGGGFRWGNSVETASPSSTFSSVTETRRRSQHLSLLHRPPFPPPGVVHTTTSSGVLSVRRIRRNHDPLRIDTSNPAATQPPLPNHPPSPPQPLLVNQNHPPETLPAVVLHPSSPSHHLLSSSPCLRRPRPPLRPPHHLPLLSSSAPHCATPKFASSQDPSSHPPPTPPPFATRELNTRKGTLVGEDELGNKYYEAGPAVFFSSHFFFNIRRAPRRCTR